MSLRAASRSGGGALARRQHSARHAITVGGAVLGTWEALQRRFALLRAGDVVVDFSPRLPSRTFAAFAAPIVVPHHAAAAAAATARRDALETLTHSQQRRRDGLLVGVDGAHQGAVGAMAAAVAYPGLLVRADAEALRADAGPLLEALLGHRCAAPRPVIDVVALDMCGVSGGGGEGESGADLERATAAAIARTSAALHAVELLLKPSARVVATVLRRAPHDGAFAGLVSGLRRAFEEVAVTHASSVAPLRPLPTGGDCTSAAAADVEAVTVIAMRRRSGGLRTLGEASCRAPTGVTSMAGLKAHHRAHVADKRHGGRQTGKMWQRTRNGGFFRALAPQRLHAPLPQDHWRSQADAAAGDAEAKRRMTSAKMGMVGAGDMERQRDD